MSDPTTEIWQKLRQEAEIAIEREPVLSLWLEARLLRYESLIEVIACNLSEKLNFLRNGEDYLRDVFLKTLQDDEALVASIVEDIIAYFERDPACKNHFNPLLNYKGFKAITGYRIANKLWKQEQEELSLHLQSLISEFYGVDIHPAATIGKGVMLDHATGFVAGETTVIGDQVSIFQGVTLGGTGKESGERHPKIEYGVLIGAGAKILGNITVGHCSKIGANSVVLNDIPPMSTVVGVPGKVTKTAESLDDVPALCVDHRIE